MFHYFVSHVTLQLCDISVVMKTANTSVPSGMGAKGLCCNGTTSESLFSFRDSLFLRCIRSKCHKLSECFLVFCMQSLILIIYAFEEKHTG